MEKQMKFSYACAGAALALAATLAACGGKAQFTVQGSVSNLNNPGLVLANGGSTVNVPAGATTFAFPQQIDYGTEYNITVQTNPAHMNCGVVSGGSGSAGHTVSIFAQVTCAQNNYSVGGQFTGLKPVDSATPRIITLINGSTGGGVTITSAGGDANGNGTFVLSSNVADGQAYGVTIAAQPQPAGLTCTLTNGAGVMHETPVSNLLLTCVPTPATP
jgi:hypothetical protein